MKSRSFLIVGIIYGIFMAVPVFAAEGIAVIKGTSPESSVSGEVKFKETKKGLTVEAKLKNVPNSRKLGFHIHENGSCEDMGKAAGGHYNPMSSSHGLLAKDGEHKAHAGDLGNVKIAKNGTGTLKGFLPGISLSGGQYNVEGRAIILHEKQDDFGQPTGNAGGRIGCGIIEIAGMQKTYTCPMHPDVHQTSPGVCPKCGMQLIEEKNKNGSKDSAMPLQSMDPKLKTSYVCMMNNKYFAKEQIPVEANGKTYYGCCQGCVASLKSNDSIRHAADPLTGEDVDKADAYIVLKPDGSDAVLYFKSAENYLKYMEKNKTQ